MTVDVETSQQDGRMHFRLGPVERWVLSLGGIVLVSVSGWFIGSINTKLDTQTVKQSELVTQQAVMTGQLANISAQLADVPSLRTQSTELKVRVDRHEEDLKELRATRGLR